jgi:hypothetical protein
MTRIFTFFKEGDSQCGVFYPKHHLLAIFPNLAEADRAKQALHDAGRKDADVISVSGEEVIHFAEEHLVKHGLWGVLVTELSRICGAEATYADDDLAAAKKGAAFLAVHCPTEKLKFAAWKVLAPRRPLVARYYDSGSIFTGIDHLTGES